MTKPIHKNSLKDERCSVSSHLKEENGSIPEHIRNHVHLTNCIHLKNHMHRHSPNMTERNLMRDLIVLQRSRSLRDPSTSPPSWVSPSIEGSFARRPVKDAFLHSGRRSISVDRRSGFGRLSTCSAVVGGVATSKVAAIEASNECNVKQKGKASETSSGEEISAKSPENLSKQQKSYKHSPESARRTDKRKSEKSIHGKVACLKTLNEHLEEVTNQIDSDNKNPPLREHETHDGEEERKKEPKESTYELCHGPTKGKKRRLKGPRNSDGSSGLKGFRASNTLLTASYLEAQGSNNHEECIGDRQEELEGGQPRNVCGILWNWSRIHHRGKTFLDKAGRSFSCGLSDSKLRRAEGSLPHREGNISNIALASDKLASSTSSDSEVLPLLIEASGSEDNGATSFLSRDYSGELKIFSDNSLRHDQDSNLAYGAISGHRQKSRGYGHGRHRSLTLKYMPKTFKDLVGQTLVVQALSNAILRKRVGLIYIFHGPHGTGKTSCARVFAKALNCRSMDHPRPCDVCSSCISHNLGRSRDALEVGTITNSDFENVMNVFNHVMSFTRSSQYKVFIFDDSETLPQNFWGGISKVIDRAPRHVVFVFVSLNLDHFPHIILSRCQKFFFPKIKESAITSTLQWISTSEGLDIDKDALKLIASRSDGSLRDAEMTLDQLSLLGQRVSLSLVQELVGLVSDEKLVDLLDFALSADTVNTVKNLREIMDSGVEPLALMSQLATIITDILAGSYVFTQERLRRKFFRQLTLSKEDMERLRQALKTLSEAEKQLRVSNDKLTWLTAALLQLAPDPHYMLPSSSTDRSFSHSPGILNYNNMRGMPRSPINEQDKMHMSSRDLSKGTENDNKGGNNVPYCLTVPSSNLSIKEQGEHTSNSLVLSKETIKEKEGNKCCRIRKEVQKIWQAVLENIQSDAVRQFLYNEGKLISVNLGAAPTVRLVFGSNASKSQAEKFRTEIVQAFECVLTYAVILEIRCETREIVRSDVQISSVQPTSENGASPVTTKRQSTSSQRSVYSGPQNNGRNSQKENIAERIGSGHARWLNSGPHVITESEIIETVDFSQKRQQIEQGSNVESREKGTKNIWIKEDSSAKHQLNLVPFSERKESEEQNKRKILVRGKVSLARVIQQAEDCSQRGGWSQRKAISIAEKLEQQNLKLEPRSRSLICWRASRRARAKLSKLRISSRRQHTLMKLMACGRCLSVKSPR